MKKILSLLFIFNLFFVTPVLFTNNHNQNYLAYADDDAGPGEGGSGGGEGDGSGNDLSGFDDQFVNEPDAGLGASDEGFLATLAGVVPIIFAISFLMFPQIAVQLLATTSSALAQSIASTISGLLSNPWIYGATYFLLVVMFTFFYTLVTFDPVKTSENLQKGGAFIPGHRPGEATTKYISDVLMRTTTVGALFLGTVAILPIILSGLTGVSAVAVGGTSLLIAVSVIIDLMKKIDAQLTMREY